MKELSSYTGNSFTGDNDEFIICEILFSSFTIHSVGCWYEKGEMIDKNVQEVLGGAK